MHKNKFENIKQEYDTFYKSFLKKGKIPYHETEKGTWGISVAEYLYEFFKQINLKKYKNFLDLGSGDGKVVLIASLFTKATGIEYDKKLFEKSIEIRDKLKLNANFIQGDFLKQNLTKYNVIFINPDKGFHNETETKLLEELKGILIVYNFIYHPRFLKKGKTYQFEQTPITIYTKK